jgi:glutamate 5-kinase
VPRIDAGVLALAGGSTSGRGLGGMITKLQAAQLATNAGIETVITNGLRPGTLAAAIEGARGGTRFQPQVSRLEARKRWLLSGLGVRGVVVVDQGAADALRRLDRSLLAAGVSAVSGAFDRGDTVRIEDPDGALIGYGQVAYPATDLVRIRGRRSAEIPQVLGYSYGDEIIHRNDLALADTIGVPALPRGESDA